MSDKLVGYDYDAAFPTLLKGLLPVGFGILGFVLAAIFGAVVSSLASMLNSASTIATMDIYYKIRKSASQYELVSAGRVFTVLFVLIAMLIAPSLDNPKFGGIFTFIQEFQGFISPGVLAIFLFGLLVHRTPRFAGTVGLILNPILYGILKWGGLTGIDFLVSLSSLSFLDRMAVCFFIVIAVLTIITLLEPLKQPVTLPVNEKMNVSVSKSAKRYGFGVVVLTVLLYIIFW
jgi:SSS family solute:Na+ symporter